MTKLLVSNIVSYKWTPRNHIYLVKNTDIQPLYHWFIHIGPLVSNAVNAFNQPKQRWQNKEIKCDQADLTGWVSWLSFLSYCCVNIWRAAASTDLQLRKQYSDNRTFSLSSWLLLNHSVAPSCIVALWRETVIAIFLSWNISYQSTMLTFSCYATVFLYRSRLAS